MEKPTKPIPKSNKRQRKGKTSASEPKTKSIKLETKIITQDVGVQKTPMPQAMFNGLTKEEISEKYPVLNNQELITKFLEVPMTNNQKGRIRQLIRENLKGTDDTLLPDVIHNRIQTILKSSSNLTDTELRKIRILYNLLNTTISSKSKSDENQKQTDAKNSKENVKVKKEKRDVKKEKGDVKKEKGDDKNENGDGNTEKKEKNAQLVQKVRGPKRYVVFLGNLPLDIDKEKITNHFVEMNEHIKDVRIPKPGEGKKSAIAYVELANEPSYELALSKHHSMLGSKRIKVLYTTQKNCKISKAEAKGKSAKLIALQKSGKLIGSIPLNKKRSHRRMILKQARAREAAANA